MQLRRATGTIQYGHLDSEIYESMNQYWEEALQPILAQSVFTAGAFALERGEKTNRLHIQFYVEFDDRLRTSTLRNLFDLFLPKHSAAFQRVIDAQGSWDYCTGTGRYADGKSGEVEDRYQFGTPKLYGPKEGTSLRRLVGMVMDGSTLKEIMTEEPYAYCVHRSRITAFWMDWNGHSHI